ncbi:hypothetical protein GZ77_15910 [Endozoicomonas montiporae]|uniref:Uncharacterized protein n=2 Tax=Endozoicomonas montiporae TaxID=1027273 RepID=A0A081N5P9_9GAMM|nr:hypothetical protein [Endozoicomonas montiporae]AMO57335.1 hypothetical protein EZMO1_3340 [Endozoicomonas montiporae CL-33]KEQ13772.1 hypothetical protein GZ77_15910 [Endozoicomonas montiporae]
MTLIIISEGKRQAVKKQAMDIQSVGEAGNKKDLSGSLKAGRRIIKANLTMVSNGQVISHEVLH